jgi:hypothetical protein
MGVPVTEAPQVAGISVVQPSEGVPMHFLVRMADGSFQRKNINSTHALRLAADLLNGAAFNFGNKEN